MIFFYSDSGGQYNYGTTDVTRTICFKKPKDSIKNIFTKVLKGHIAVATTNLNKFNTGKQLDKRARKFLNKVPWIMDMEQAMVLVIF